MPKTKVQVVCVGLPRTGTQSMAAALELLGYSVLHEALPKMETDYTQPFKLSDLGKWDADCIMDALIWNLLIEANYNAKVILTYRDRGQWWRSIHGHIDRIHARCTSRQRWEEIEEVAFIHAALFGSRWPQAGLYLQRYDLHRLAVEMFCQKINRPLLIHKSSDGWGSLCNFLDKPIPSEPYPHRNGSPMPALQAIEHRDNER